MLYMFSFLMIFSIIYDALTMRIPNWISAALAASYIVCAVYTQQPVLTILSNFAVAFAILACTFLLFARGIIGGGDGKLIAAVALWFGWSEQLLAYILIAGVLGGALSIAALCSRNIAAFFPHPSWAPVWMVKNGHGVPYGMALGISGLIVFPGTFTSIF